MALSEEQTVSKFISSRPYNDSIGMRADLSVLPEESHAFEFDQLQFSKVRDIETLTVDYHSHGANQLVFSNPPGLQLHLRRTGTGLYSFDRSRIIEGQIGEMQIYCSSHPWEKSVFERAGAHARSMVFGVSRELAQKYIGQRVRKVYQHASASFFHARMPVPLQLLPAIDELFSYGGEGIANIRREAKLLEILAESLEEFRGKLAEDQIYTGHYPQDVARIHAAEEHIRADLAAYSGINALAAISGMSASKFKTLFREVTGYSVGAYVRHARMQKAADLLDQNWKVSEVAYALGYHHIGHFAKAFRCAHHMTPSEFRSHRNRMRIKH